MNEKILVIAEEISRSQYHLGDNYSLESYSINRKKAKLIFCNDSLMTVTVEIPYFLIEATVEERYAETE